MWKNIYSELKSIRSASRIDETIMSSFLLTCLLFANSCKHIGYGIFCWDALKTSKTKLASNADWLNSLLNFLWPKIDFNPSPLTALTLPFSFKSICLKEGLWYWHRTADPKPKIPSAAFSNHQEPPLLATKVSNPKVEILANKKTYKYIFHFFIPTPQKKDSEKFFSRSLLFHPTQKKNHTLWNAQLPSPHASEAVTCKAWKTSLPKAVASTGVAAPPAEGVESLRSTKSPTSKTACFLRSVEWFRLGCFQMKEDSIQILKMVR